MARSVVRSFFMFAVLVLLYPGSSVAKPIFGSSELDWARVEKKFDDEKWITTLTFFSKKNRKLGAFYDRKGRSLVPDGDGWMKKSVVVKKRNLLVTAWVDGARTHIYRVFDPSASPSKPKCELYGHGDPEIETRINKKNRLELKVQVQPGQYRWKQC